jgi:hypothetical protein
VELTSQSMPDVVVDYSSSACDYGKTPSLSLSYPSTTTTSQRLSLQSSTQLPCSASHLDLDDVKILLGTSDRAVPLDFGQAFNWSW